jgi:hypothetical protein
VGIVLTWALAGTLEPWAAVLIRRINPDYGLADPVMTIHAAEVVSTLQCVFLGSVVGTLFPCWKAMTLDPIQDLRTGL